MNITVAYALPHKQTLEEMDVPDGTTVEEAISMSHLLEKHPEIDLPAHKVGVLGKLVTMKTGLRDGDRVEIYRSLQKRRGMPMPWMTRRFVSAQERNGGFPNLHQSELFPPSSPLM